MVIKNKIFLFFVSKIDIKSKVFKYIKRYLKILLSRFLVSIKLTKTLKILDKNFYVTRIKNVCIFSGRHSGVYRYFKMSRIVLKNTVSSNIIYGVRKSSW